MFAAVFASLAMLVLYWGMLEPASWLKDLPWAPREAFHSMAPRTLPGMILLPTNEAARYKRHGYIATVGPWRIVLQFTSRIILQCLQQEEHMRTHCVHRMVVGHNRCKHRKTKPACPLCCESCSSWPLHSLHTAYMIT